MGDMVNHPPHYTAHPSGVECIQVTEHMGFCVGNAMKYLWRAGEKGDAIEDLEKARWYVDREISRLERERDSRTITGKGEVAYKFKIATDEAVENWLDIVYGADR